MDSDYAQYVRLEEFSGLPSSAAARESSHVQANEHFFMVVHQASELLGASASRSAQFEKLFALFGTVGAAGSLLKSFWSTVGECDRTPPEALAVARGLDAVAVEMSARQCRHIPVATTLVGQLPGTGGTAGLAWLEQRRKPASTGMVERR